MKRNRNDDEDVFGATEFGGKTKKQNSHLLRIGKDEEDLFEHIKIFDKTMKPRIFKSIQTIFEKYNQLQSYDDKISIILTLTKFMSELSQNIDDHLCVQIQKIFDSESNTLGFGPIMLYVCKKLVNFNFENCPNLLFSIAGPVLLNLSFTKMLNESSYLTTKYMIEMFMNNKNLLQVINRPSTHYGLVHSVMVSVINNDKILLNSTMYLIENFPNIFSFKGGVDTVTHHILKNSQTINNSVLDKFLSSGLYDITEFSDDLWYTMKTLLDMYLTDHKNVNTLIQIKNEMLSNDVILDALFLNYGNEDSQNVMKLIERNKNDENIQKHLQKLYPLSPALLRLLSSDYGVHMPKDISKMIIKYTQYPGKRISSTENFYQQKTHQFGGGLRKKKKNVVKRKKNYYKI